MEQQGAKIKVTISNYEIDGIFPIYDAGYNGEVTRAPINYTENMGIFSVGYFQVLVPDNEESLKGNCNYYFTVSDSNMNTKSISDTTATTQMKKDDDSIRTNHHIYIPGTYEQDIQLHNINHGIIESKLFIGDGYSVVGQTIYGDFKFNMSLSGDTEALDACKFIKFDGEAFEPILINSTQKYVKRNFVGDMEFNVWYVTKKDGTNWTSQEDMNNGNIEDMVLYENISDIPNGNICVGEFFESKGGKLTRVSGDNNIVEIALKIKDTATIGKVYGITQRTKVWEEKLDRDTYTVTKKGVEFPKATWDSTNRNYIKTEYDENGQIKSGTHNGGSKYGESVLVIGANLSITKQIVEKNQDGSEKTNYDLGKNETEVEYALTPALQNGKNITGVKLEITETLPKGLIYIEESSNKGEPKVTKNSDGTTTLTWYIENCSVGKAIEPITYKAHMDDQTINGTQFETTTVVSEVIEEGQVSKIGNARAEARTAKKTISVINLSSYSLFKTTETPVIELDGDVQYKITAINKTDDAIPDFQVLDILPYNGDGRGSNFSGSYTVSKIDIKQTKDNGQQVLKNDNLKLYITTKESVRKGVTAKDTNLGKDTNIWEEISPGSAINKNIVAYAIVGKVAERVKLEADIHIKTKGNKPEDSYRNSATAQTNKNTEAMETPIIIVQDIKRRVEGYVWFDSNKNGLKDEDESYMPNVELSLKTKSGEDAIDVRGQKIEPIRTDANGHYKFEDMVKGEYKVLVKVENSKHEITKKKVGENDEINSKFNADGSTDTIKKLNQSTEPVEEEKNVNAGITYKDAKVIVHHYIENTKISLSNDVTIDGKINDSYITHMADDIESKYELVEIPANAQGVMEEEETVVIYYYKIKSAKVIVHHYIEGTIVSLSPDETIDGRVDDLYTTKPAEVGVNYKCVNKKPEKSQGVMTEETIVVTYYYRLEEPIIESSIEKTGAKEITSSKDEVEYSIKFTGKIEKYLGEGKIKIVDYLPYKIDKEKSSLDGGMYDVVSQTITWEEDLDITNIKNEKDSYKIEITKNIKLVYKDMDITQRSMTNKVEGKIELYGAEGNDQKEAEHKTDVNIKGKVIAKYVDEETGEEIEKEEEQQGYAGEKYKTEEKQIPYYDFIEEKTPENKEGTYTEEEQVVTYYYRKQKFNIGVEKRVKEIKVDGKDIGKGKNISKIEVVGTKINKAKVEIKYEIIVKNTGEIDGTAELLEKLPLGYKIAETNPEYWEEQKNGNLKTKVEVKAGEEKKLEVVLRWKNSSNNLGTKTNTVEIIGTENPSGHEEETKEDNTSEAIVVMSIKTGETQNIIIISFVIVLIICGLIIYYIEISKYIQKLK